MKPEPQRHDRSVVTLLESLWLGAAVALPLACNPWGASAFELPKAALLRVLALLMLLAALAQALERPGTPVHRCSWPLLGPALALGLAFALSTAFSVSPRTSLWGSHMRQQGLLSLLSYLAVALLTAAHVQTPAQAGRLWAALVWGSAPVVAYGLLQAARLDPLAWRTDAASPVLSTVGRANFLGSYLVLVVPLTLARALAARRRWPCALLLAGQLVCLAATQARGAYVGLGVALIAVGLAWAAATRRRRPALAALGAAALALAFVLVLNLPGGPLARLARLPGLDRLATLADTGSGSSAARLTIWRACLRLVAARPWLGYGPDTLQSIFAGVYPPQLVYYQGRQTAVDRAHNLWLDLALSAGLVGVLAFLGLLVALARLVWRGLRTAAGSREQLLRAALVAALAGHLADLHFGFDLTASAMTFWLVVALGARAALAAHNPPDTGLRAGAGLAAAAGVSPSPAVSAQTPEFRPAGPGPRAERTGLRVLYLPPALALLALLWLATARPLLADAAYWRSLQAEGQAACLPAATRAVRLWPLEPAYRLGLARALFEAGDPAAAEAQLRAAERLSPADPHVLLAQGELYVRWAQLDPTRLPLAEDSYRRALALAPDVSRLHLALGLVLAQQGRPEEGTAELERAVALDTTDGLAFAHLAELYRAQGRGDQAAWAEREARRWGGE